jgi:hypothetical protein
MMRPSLAWTAAGTLVITGGRRDSVAFVSGEHDGVTIRLRDSLDSGK